MTDYSREIQRIESARSLDEIRDIANNFPARAQGEGGILYSGKVGEVSAEVIAKELALKTGSPLINNTPRAQFLSDKPVYDAIHDTTQRILAEQGVPLGQADKSGWDFLYGNGKAPTESPLSVKNSLWGEASAEFAGSARGHVVVVASAANAERVLAKVEVPTVLNGNQIASLGGRALPELQSLHVHGGMQAVLPEVQASFIDASTKGIFIDPGMAGKPVTQVAISREAASALNLDSSKFIGAKALSEAGFVPAPIQPSAPALAAAAVDTSLAADAAAASRGLHPGVTNTLGAVGVGLMAVDAYQTAQQYQALSAKGNQFGADALLHHYEGRTAGGLVGGFAAGATYGAIAGSESGPGALVTGAVGGVVGAFAGDKIATAYNEHQVNHQTGTDGQTYAFDKGQWTQTQHHVGLNSYDLPTISSTTTHAPAEQLATLDYKRTTAVTALALANPATQDTKSITLGNTEWHASQEGWTKTVSEPSLGIGSVELMGQPVSSIVPADAKTSAQLNQISANRQFNNDHYAEAVSKAYVMDYYGKGWDKQGPLPDAVTKTLKLPSEEHVKDPVTGNTWTAAGKGNFTRDEVSVGYDTPVTNTVKASGDELARVSHQQQTAAQTNASYGSQLIAQKYAELKTPAQQHTTVAPAHAAEPSAPQQGHANTLGAQAPNSPHPTAAAGPGRDDPRHADNPNHALYQQLKERIPEAGEKRLLQFTAACHEKGITDKNIGRITYLEDQGMVQFRTAVELRPPAMVDVKNPSPEPQQSIQNIQHTDQTRAQTQAQIQAQNAQVNQQQQGPTMTLGPAGRYP